MTCIYFLGINYICDEKNDNSLKLEINSYIDTHLTHKESVYAIFAPPVISSRRFATYLDLFECVKKCAITHISSMVVYILDQHRRVVFSVYMHNDTNIAINVCECTHISSIEENKTKITQQQKRNQNLEIDDISKCKKHRA
jgi:hypothetical protein